MANSENLKSYRKGESGNPNGRPKGSWNVSTVLAEMLRQIAPKVVMDASFIKEIARTRKRATIAEAAAARIVYQGIVKGDSWALKELLDRTEGKAKQVVDIRTNEGIDYATAIVNSWLERQRQLNLDYGVPMPDKEQISDMVKGFAEHYGVIESDLSARVNMPSVHPTA